MNITKHGVLSRDELNTETFKCKECGCEFTADYDEYYVEKGSHFTTSSSLIYTTYSATVTDTYVCSCPECHKIVIKTKQRSTVEHPTITLSATDTTKISEACINCLNHPSNDDSGICNCTSGSMDQIKCECSEGGTERNLKEAFNTIRDAYNAPENREKILLNYLARNACCCEQKLLNDSGQFADMPTMQSAT